MTFPRSLMVKPLSFKQMTVRSVLTGGTKEKKMIKIRKEIKGYQTFKKIVEERVREAWMKHAKEMGVGLVNSFEK